MSFSEALSRVAHRGGAALAPENTLAAFQHALTLPVDALELDVQMSHDGHAIVFHDEHVERLTEGQGNILDLDFAYLRSLNAAAHFAGGWPQRQVMPTLREVLAVARAGQVGVYIEIKPGRRANGDYQRYPGIAEAVVEDILALEMTEQVMVMSFDWEILPRLKDLLPGLVTGALVSAGSWKPQESLAELLARVQELRCEWVNLDRALFTPSLLEACHRHGLKLGLWTVNTEDDLRALSRSGVDSLTTDRPDLFASLG